MWIVVTYSDTATPKGEDKCQHQGQVTHHRGKMIIHLSCALRSQEVAVRPSNSLYKYQESGEHWIKGRVQPGIGPSDPGSINSCTSSQYTSQFIKQASSEQRGTLLIRSKTIPIQPITIESITNNSKTRHYQYDVLPGFTATYCIITSRSNLNQPWSKYKPMT